MRASVNIAVYVLVLLAFVDCSKKPSQDRRRSIEEGVLTDWPERPHDIVVFLATLPPGFGEGEDEPPEYTTFPVTSRVQVCQSPSNWTRDYWLCSARLYRSVMGLMRFAGSVGRMITATVVPTTIGTPRYSQNGSSDMPGNVLFTLKAYLPSDDGNPLPPNRRKTTQHPESGYTELPEVTQIEAPPTKRASQTGVPDVVGEKMEQSQGKATEIVNNDQSNASDSVTNPGVTSIDSHREHSSLLKEETKRVDLNKDNINLTSLQISEVVLEKSIPADGAHMNKLETHQALPTSSNNTVVEDNISVTRVKQNTTVGKEHPEGGYSNATKTEAAPQQNLTSEKTRQKRTTKPDDGVDAYNQHLDALTKITQLLAAEGVSSFNAITDQLPIERHLLGHGKPLGNIVQDQPTVASLMRDAMREITARRTDGGYLLVVFGGELWRGGRQSEAARDLSEAMKEVRGGNRTLVVVTGQCPSGRCEDVPVYAVGPGSEHLGEATHVWEVLRAVRRATTGFPMPDSRRRLV